MSCETANLFATPMALLKHDACVAVCKQNDVKIEKQQTERVHKFTCSFAGNTFDKI